MQLRMSVYVIGTNIFLLITDYGFSPVLVQFTIQFTQDPTHDLALPTQDKPATETRTY
jgi:hypothetical protein